VREFVPEHESERLAVERFESFHRLQHKVKTVIDVLRRLDLNDSYLVDQAQAKTALPQTASKVVGNATPSDTKEPESVLGRCRYLLKTPPSYEEDLGHHVVDLVSRNSTCHVLGDVAEEERVHPLEFRRSLVAHPDPSPYFAQ